MSKTCIWLCKTGNAQLLNSRVGSVFAACPPCSIYGRQRSSASCAQVCHKGRIGFCSLTCVSVVEISTLCLKAELVCRFLESPFLAGCNGKPKRHRPLHVSFEGKPCRPRTVLAPGKGKPLAPKLTGQLDSSYVFWSYLGVQRKFQRGKCPCVGHFKTCQFFPAPRQRAQTLGFDVERNLGHVDEHWKKINGNRKIQGARPGFALDNKGFSSSIPGASPLK